MSESVILLAHVEAEAGTHCSDQCDLRTGKAYIQALLHGSQTSHPCCEFGSGLLIISSVPSLDLVLFCCTVSVPVPQESEHHLASVSPHPRRIFLAGMEGPRGHRSVPVCSLQDPKHLAQCLGHSRPLIMFAYGRE